MHSEEAAPRVLALCGGVGGAKLALGLAQLLGPGELMVATNTGDDFDHLDLRICPDIDTVTYTLAGIANPETGWGRAEESGHFMEALARLGGETWFFLGDRDLATHVERTRRLRAGESLSAITADFCRRLGIESLVVPMSDDPVRTVIETASGPLAFQHYFVRERCQPAVRGLRYEGVEEARPQRRIMTALSAPGLEAVVLCPSNPFLSLDPILRLPGMAWALRSAAAPKIAVSPIIGGRALKGPAAKIMAELGQEPSAYAVAEHYADLLDAFMLDAEDANLRDPVAALGLHVAVANTVMSDLADKTALARMVLDLARRLRR